MISATNLTEAGPLSVLKDCLAHASSRLATRFRILALVHDRNLFGELPGVEFMGVPLAKKSWLIRLFYEWFGFYRLSQKLKPFLWISLHDLSSRVIAQKRAVYCHNPAMFYPLSVQEALREPGFTVFNKLYPLAYRINIGQNDWVIVQQEWLREEFRSRYPVRQVIVAHPSVPEPPSKSLPARRTGAKKVFFFPAFPRFFKNFEVIGEASRRLMLLGRTDFEVRITLLGNENRYAERIARNYADLSVLCFLGLQPRQRVYELYEETDCLIFPSRLETWGMPLTEFKHFGRPILAADLPYARETIGDYPQVRFFDPCDPDDLALRMDEFLNGRLRFDRCKTVPPSPPFAEDWEALFEILVADRQEPQASPRSV